jgi:hypothetical protein
MNLLGCKRTIAQPPRQEPADKGLVLDAILAEHQAIRAQILFQMGRANRLATLGIGAAAALLTTIVGLNVLPDLQFTVAGLVSVGLAVIALSYVGVDGSGTLSCMNPLDPASKSRPRQVRQGRRKDGEPLPDRGSRQRPIPRTRMARLRLRLAEVDGCPV